MKKKVAQVAPPTPPVAHKPRVCVDHQRHTVIETSRDDILVEYIPLDISGLVLCQLSIEAFDKQYHPLPDYPVEKAAGLYAEYAANLGGTPDAMRELGKLVPLTPKEIDVATTKAAAKVPAKKAIKHIEDTAAAKASVAAKKAKAAGKPAAKKVAKEPAEKKPTAAQMFKDLIMAGELTDDKIFAKVQKAFGLDDNKRSYVKWYRNDLVKRGEKPPAAKE
jgi:hypothetical protein